MAEIADKVARIAIADSDVDKFKYPVVVDWHTGQGNIWWNETCAMVLEVFGLPGQRFYYTPTPNSMKFSFKTAQDQQLCQILLSDRI